MFSHGNSQKKIPETFAISDVSDLDFLVVPYPPQRPGGRRAPVPGAAADLRVLRVGRPEAVQVDVQGDEGTLLVQILGPWEKLTLWLCQNSYGK